MTARRWYSCTVSSRVACKRTGGPAATRQGSARGTVPPITGGQCSQGETWSGKPRTPSSSPGPGYWKRRPFQGQDRSTAGTGRNEDETG